MTMSAEKAQEYVIALYRELLNRDPRPDELRSWADMAQRSQERERIFFSIISSNEYSQRRRVKAAFPPGHFFSPIVDPEAVREYLQTHKDSSAEGFVGIDLDAAAMEHLWLQHREVIQKLPFSDQQQSDRRFYYNTVFSYGDAISMFLMFSELRPKNVIEIGSGYSSACMLDSAEALKLSPSFTFIEPNTKRLMSLLKPQDVERVRIFNSPVQNIPLEEFGILQANDILFIDSTHVLKTGSDVHHELFHILPVLAKGVYIHFHDIQYPFEYPDQWINTMNYSWNEIYALRAFLMYNSWFRIRFWGSYFAAKRRDLVAETIAQFLKNTGGSIWIEKVH